MSDTENKETEQFIFHAPKEEKEKLREGSESMSAKMRHALTELLRAEEEYDMLEDTQQMNLVVLRTYLSTIDKHIQILQSKRDELKSHIEDIEDKIENDEEDDTVIEIDLSPLKDNPYKDE